MNEQNQRVPDMLLELYLLGELSAEQMRDVEARLAAEPGGPERIESLRQSNEAILTEYPVMEMARKIEHAAQRSRFEQKRAPMIDVSKRWDVVLAAAILLLSCAALGGYLLWGQVDAPEGVNPHNAPLVGGGMNPGTANEMPTGTNPDEEHDPVVARNERAIELKRKLERGEPVKQDVDTTGLVLALERKANQALLNGDRQEAIETCESAKEFDDGACPWLAQALGKFDEEGPESLEALESLGVDDVESPDPEEGKRLFQEGTKSMLKGKWELAIKQCRVGLAHGERRCHRVLGISYKNIGEDQRACDHLKRIGASGHDGLVCD